MFLKINKIKSVVDSTKQMFAEHNSLCSAILDSKSYLLHSLRRISDSKSPVISSAEERVRILNRKKIRDSYKIMLSAIKK